jgi:TolA-binding protein
LAVILAGGAVFSLKHWAFSKNSMLPAVYAVATPTFEAVPVGIAEWRVEHIDGAVRATLGDGRMAIHVTKLTHGQRFVVFLPDGELEVRGTRFFVEVREGRTRRVDVVEGTIALRLQSSRERSLAGGESFIQGPLESVPESSPEPRTAVPIPSPPAAPSRLRGTVKSGQPARLASHDARASATELTSSAGVLFAEAMAVYGAGSFDRADSMFAEFHRRFPEDTRCEDADFLRVVSRHRMGDGEGAEERSRAYLTEHPGGLRRDEVEALLHRRGTP